MKTKSLIMLFIAISFVTYAQKEKVKSRWYSTANIDFVFANSKKYFYVDSEHVIHDPELEMSGFLLNSFGLEYTFNYLLFSKLSLGAVGGFQIQSDPNYNMFKLGAVLKFFFVDRDNVYIYLQDARNISLNTDDFKTSGSGNTRLGLGFPVLKKPKFNLNTNIFFEQNYFVLDDADPLLGLEDEIPRSLTVKSFAISFGIQF